jgi:hypothetical protein
MVLLLVSAVDCRMIGSFGSRSGRSIVVCVCTSLSRLRCKGGLAVVLHCLVTVRIGLIVV